MPISAFSAWSTNPASNTDIGGVTLSNTMTPTQIDDAIRNLMAQLKTALNFGVTDNLALRVDGTAGGGLQTSPVLISDAGILRIPTGGGIEVQNADGVIDIYGKLVIDGTIDNIVKVRIEGVPSNDQAISIQGSTNAYAMVFQNASGTIVGSIRITGGGTTITTTSDGRLKPERKAFDSGAIIDALEPVYHNWLETPEAWDYGLIAQDLHDVVPQAVIPGSEDGPGGDFTPWQADYSKLVPILVREVKHLRARVAQLESDL